MARIEEGDSKSHDHFHPKERIIGQSGCIEVRCDGSSHCSVDLEHGARNHAPDGEADLGQVKVACQHLFAHLDQHVLESVPQLVDDSLVHETVASVLRVVLSAQPEIV